MSTLEFFVYGIPKAQPRPRAFARKFGDKWQARVYDAGTAEEWKGLIAAAVRPVIPATPIEGPVELTIMFYMPRPKNHFRSNGDIKPKAPNFHTSKPDLDNLEKAVKDALTQLQVWRDDSQVALKITEKRYTQTGAPGANIKVRSLQEFVTLADWPVKEVANG